MPNAVESVFRNAELPIAPDRRRQDRVRTRMPIRIFSIDGNPVLSPGICTNELRLEELSNLSSCRLWIKQSAIGSESCSGTKAIMVDTTSTTMGQTSAPQIETLH